VWALDLRAVGVWGFRVRSFFLWVFLGWYLFGVGLFGFFFCLLYLGVSCCILPIYFGVPFIFNKI
jgi:hypothetical protein